MTALVGHQMDCAVHMRHTPITIGVTCLLNCPELQLSPNYSLHTVACFGGDYSDNLEHQLPKLRRDISTLNETGLTHPKTGVVHPVVQFLTPDGACLCAIYNHTSNASNYPQPLSHCDKKQSKLIQQRFFGKSVPLSLMQAIGAKAPKNATKERLRQFSSNNLGFCGPPLLNIDPKHCTTPQFHTWLCVFRAAWKRDSDLALQCGTLKVLAEHARDCLGQRCNLEFIGRGGTPKVHFKGNDVRGLL